MMSLSEGTSQVNIKLLGILAQSRFDHAVKKSIVDNRLTSAKSHAVLIISVWPTLLVQLEG